MFKWFKNKILEVKEEVKESRRNYRLEFLKNLSKEECKLYYNLSLGYLHQFVLYYTKPRIKVTLEYNDVRNKWDIEIWSDEINNFLFYYDCLDLKPYKAINYMLEKYNIRERLNKKLISREKREQEEYNKKQEVLNKYLNHE